MRSLALLALALAACPAFAENATTLQACRAITDAAKRLACYDALPLGTPAAPATAGATPPAAAAPTATPAAPDPAKFGFEAKSVRAMSVDSIDSQIDGRSTAVSTAGARRTASSWPTARSGRSQTTATRP
jgi:hypothetical protein